MASRSEGSRARLKFAKARVVTRPLALSTSSRQPLPRVPALGHGGSGGVHACVCVPLCVVGGWVGVGGVGVNARLWKGLAWSTSSRSRCRAGQQSRSQQEAQLVGPHWVHGCGSSGLAAERECKGAHAPAARVSPSPGASSAASVAGSRLSGCAVCSTKLRSGASWDCTTTAMQAEDWGTPAGQAAGGGKPPLVHNKSC